jgi:tRNA(Ile)-lysidine synthase TilS/MesJ
MKSKIKTCTKCLLNENYPNINFDENGICTLCNTKNIIKPLGEEKLLKIFSDNKNDKSEFDALVPISGGKDSTYILHLAVNVYKLKVLTMTYDNGLLSDIAKENIAEAVSKANVKHIYSRSDNKVQKRIYKQMLLLTGDICGACDIATKAHIIKIARQYKVPMILYGTSPLEEDSFVPDSIQDISRFKYILRKSKEFSQKEISDFLIYPSLNLFKLSFWKRTKVLGKEIRPLFYIKNPTDKEMGEIIKKEFGWHDNNSSEYSKHFDCVAEPFTNYIRNKIYAYERRVCQYSNMIRRDEITKEKALEMYSLDNISDLPNNYKTILNILELEEKDINTIINNTPLKYEKHISKTNKIFAKLMKLKNSY